MAGERKITIALPLPARLFDFIERRRPALETTSQATISILAESGGIRPLVIEGTDDQCGLARRLIVGMVNSHFPDMCNDNIEMHLHCNMQVEVRHIAALCGVEANCKSQFGNHSVWQIVGHFEKVRRATDAIRKIHFEVYSALGESSAVGGTPTSSAAGAKRRRMVPSIKIEEIRRVDEGDQPASSVAQANQPASGVVEANQPATASSVAESSPSTSAADQLAQIKLDLSYLKSTLNRIRQLYNHPDLGQLRSLVQSALKHYDIKQIDKKELASGSVESLAQPKEIVEQLILELEEMQRDLV